VFAQTKHNRRINQFQRRGRSSRARQARLLSLERLLLAEASRPGELEDAVQRHLHRALDAIVLWQDPATAMRERKRLIRLLAIDVT
jgi:hypothetical protein